MVVAAVAVVLLVVVPLAELLAAAAAGGWTATMTALGTGVGVRAAANTVWTGVVVAVAAVSIGTAAALVTERSAAPAPRALRACLALPLLVPGFVAALSWARAYGPGGLVDDMSGVAMPGLFGAVGVVAVLVVEAVPIAYLLVAAALRSAREADAERAALISGASTGEALRTVTVPLLRPAVAGAAVLVFVTAVNAFGVPAVLGLPGGFVTATTRIYADLALAADPAAFQRAVGLSVALMVLALAAVAMLDRKGVGPPAPRGGGPTTAMGVRSPLRWPGGFLWGYVVVAVAVPLAALVLTALTRAVGLLPVPQNWTGDNFVQALEPRAAAAFGTSVAVAAIAATTVGVLAAVLVAIRRTPIGRAFATLTAVPFAVPGTVLAVALLLAYGPLLRDTLVIVSLAYVAKFWALGHRSLAGAADGLPLDLIRAARSSGADGRTALRTVVVPLLAPALAAAWVMVFLFGLHELTMSSLLYGPGTRTIAVVILNRTQVGDVTVTSALAVILTTAVLALTPLLWLVRRTAPWLDAS